MILAIPVSAGELVDKITILEIKLKQLKNKSMLSTVRSELRILDLQFKRMLREESEHDAAIKGFKRKLSNINSKLWIIEDKIRQHESKKIFDANFIKLARSIYSLNDKRSAIKSKINSITDSFIQEQKQYKSYR